jgi:hypothetical protein
MAESEIKSRAIIFTVLVRLRYLPYRPLMRLLHRFDLHYAPKKLMADGSVMRWCEWCGMRDVERRVNIVISALDTSDLKPGMISTAITSSLRNSYNIEFNKNCFVLNWPATK